MTVPLVDTDWWVARQGLKQRGPPQNYDLRSFELHLKHLLWQLLSAKCVRVYLWVPEQPGHLIPLLASYCFSVSFPFITSFLCSLLLLSTSGIYFPLLSHFSFRRLKT